MEKNVDKKNPLEELFKKHYVSGERAYDYADDAELEDYLDRLQQSGIFAFFISKLCIAPLF